MARPETYVSAENRIVDLKRQIVEKDQLIADLQAQLEGRQKP